MPIQHRLIPDSQLHEPKGVVSAPSNSVYHANGLGSGLWKAVDKNSLGIPGGNVGDTVVLGNGDTFATRTDFAFGAMHIVNNSTNYSWDGHPSFGSSDQYKFINGQGCPWTSLAVNTNVSASNGSLVANVPGLYRYDMDVVFDRLGPLLSAQRAMRGGFTLNDGQSLHPSNGSFHHSLYIVTEDSGSINQRIYSGIFKHTAFLQLSSGNYLNPAFEPLSQQYQGATVSSAMVSLTLIRGA